MRIRKSIYLYVLWSVLFLISAFNVLALTELKVTADRVNLRARPGQYGDVVLQVSSGDIVIATGNVSNNWVQIVPPEKTSFWVYGELVKEGVVAASKLCVRSKAGINYQSVGKLKKGDKLIIRGSRVGWLEIAPPSCSVLWINQKYVEECKRKSTKLIKKKAYSALSKTIILPENNTSNKSSGIINKSSFKLNASTSNIILLTSSKRQKNDIPLPSKLAGRKLVDSMEQGVKVELTGILLSSWLAWGRPSRYLLARQDKKGRIIGTYYIYGSESQLAGIMDKTIQLYGWQYRLQGVRYPVIVPERLVIQKAH